MQHEHGQLDASVPGGPLVAVQQAVPPPQPPQQHHFWDPQPPQHHHFWDAVHGERAARVAAILAAVGIVILPVGQGEAG
jgi:hypothetical protein